ncbi:MAG: FAD-dependent oxidoreductase [Chitinophagales bacterium]
MKDLLIIGGGFAGINMAWQAHVHGLSFDIADTFNKRSSTAIAAGLINPVTGRKFSLQWNMDALLSTSIRAYKGMETLFNKPLIYPHTILRLFTEESKNHWEKATYQPGIQDYTEEIQDMADTFPQALAPLGGIRIKNALRVDTEALIEGFQHVFPAHILQKNISYDELPAEKDHWCYQDREYKNLIFCEGIHGKQNPYFPELAFKPAKGECLHARIPGLDTTYILQKGVVLIPVRKDLWWVGATNTWDDMDTSVTAASGKFLEDGIRSITDLPYTIESHLAAIRPSMRDRMPVVGVHKQHNTMYILNGLGTKGASLAPFYAERICDHILQGTPLPEHVSPYRFVKA